MSINFRFPSTPTKLTVALICWLMLFTLAHAVTCSAIIGSVNFGDVNVIGNTNPAIPLATSSAPISVTCTWGLLELIATTTVCLSIGAGSGGSDNVSYRSMLNGTQAMYYNLYKDAGYSQPWGGLGTFLATGPKKYLFQGLNLLGKTETQSDTLYAKIDGNQSTLPVGNYQSSFTQSSYSLVTYDFGNLNCSATTTQYHPATFNVSATIIPHCQITTHDLNFPDHAGAITADIDAETLMEVTCTNGALYNIGLDKGTGVGASTAVRKMTHTNGINTINYSLYTTSGRTTVWDNSCGTLQAPSGTCVTNQTPPPITVYGRVFAGQNDVIVGTYSDTITATLTF